MNNIYQKTLLLICIISLSAPYSSKATHVMGADIQYQSLGHDSFEIIVHAYRDCNGIPISGTNLTYFSPGDTCVPTAVTPKTSICCGTDITPVCSRSCDRCQGASCSFAYGIEEFTITAIIYLPGPCCKYSIAWQENSRSSAITTGAANQNCYVEDQLDRCIRPGLSSPYFSVPPITIFCTNQCTVLSPGIIDNDVDSAGRPDSLSFSFGYPQSAEGSNIPYNSPYTYDAPLIYAGSSKSQAFVPPYCYGFHLDSTTGDIEFKAVKQDVSVYVLVVDIYRRNSKGIAQNVGQIKRDLEIIAITCPADYPPVVAGINGGSSYAINICSGQQTCFNVKAFDLTPTDTVSMTWNNPGTMKGATFSATSSNQKWPTAMFCWTPQKSDISANPYIFVANTINNVCPIPGRASKSFSIYVTGEAPQATYSATIQKCGLVNFQANPAVNSTAISSYIWTGDSISGAKSLNINGKSGSYQYNSQGVYHYTLTITGQNGCISTYRDSVTIDKLPAIRLPGDTSICPKTELIVNAIPSNYTKPYTITWNTGDTGASIHQYIIKDTVLRAGIKDATGCTIYDSMRVNLLPLPAAKTVANQSICLGNAIDLGDSSVKGDTYVWTSFPQGFSSSISNPTDKPTATTIYILKENNNFGCSNTDSVTITVNPLPIANPGTNSTVCKGDKALIGIPAITGYHRSWTSSPLGFSSTLANPVVMPDTTTTYFLTETILSTGCHKTNSVTVTVLDKPLPDAHWFMNYLGPESYFHATDSSLTDSSYFWVFGDGNSGDGHSIKHSYVNNQSYNVALVVKNTNGCTNEMDSTIDVQYMGIEPDTKSIFTLSIYPNPFSSSTTVQYTLNKPSKISISLFDVTGRQMKTVVNTTLDIGSYQTEINAEKYNLNPGVYFLKIMTDDGYISRQIVKL